MINNFGFIDESGVLTPQADQRFFALGLLKLEDTSTLYDRLVVLKNQVISKILEDKKRKGQPPPKKLFEFKFSSITKSSHTFYFDLINLFFKFPNLSFCCLLFDKQNPDFNVSNHFNELWDAYISYSMMLIRNNIKEGENICIIADYLGKPKSSPRYFEREVKSLKGVYNACMIESHASLFIQLVDVLVGCIVYDYNIFRGKRQKTDKFKRKVCDFLKRKISRNTLEGNFTVKVPNDFSILEFRPK